MANKILWDAAWVDQGDLLTTELNSLANAAYSAVGTAFDNTSGLARWASAEIVLGSLTPTAGAYLMLFLVQSLDGTNYEDAPSSTNPGMHMAVAILNVATGAAAKRVMAPPFALPAGKFKPVLLNGTGAAFPASGNTVALYTSDDEVQ